MNRKYMVLGGLLLLACGCNSTGGLSNTGAGALGGGALGAGLGALVGGASGHAGRGAIIGGAAGAAVGALAGNSADQAEKRQEKREEQRLKALQAAQPTPLTVPDVINMAHSHVEDVIIIQQIRSTGSNFRLQAQDLATLRAEGVSEAVVLEMQQPHTVVYQQSPVIVQPGPVIVQEPATAVYVRPGGYYRRW